MKPYRYLPIALVFGAATLLAFVPSIAAEPKSATEAYENGKAFLDKKDFDSAIAAFTKLSGSIRNTRSPTGAVRQSMRKSADYKTAFADYAVAIHLDPTDARAFLHAGLRGNGRPRQGHR